MAAAQAVEALAFRFLVILEAVFFESIWIGTGRQVIFQYQESNPQRFVWGSRIVHFFFRSFPLQLYFDETLVTRTEW